MPQMTNAKPYRIWIPVLWGVIGLMLVALAVGAFAGVPMSRLLPQCGLVLLLSASALFKFHAARSGVAQAAQQSEAIFSGECMAHWQYTAQEWSAYADRAYARTQPIVARKLRFLIPVIVVCMAIPFVASGAFSEPWPWPALIGLPLLAIAAGVIYFFYSIPSRGRAKLLRSKPEVWIGPDGVFQIGQYSPWSLAGRRLASVKLDRTDAPEIVFTILIGAAPVQVYTPVPRGQERQAAEVVQRLSETKPVLDRSANA